MTCSACGHENRAGRKFCAECGGPLALACGACGTPYEAGEKFCGECGAALGASTLRPPATPTAEAGARKVVTIVFADLVGSTALHERLDAESAQRVMARYYEALRAAVEAHGGTVVKLLGDGVMAAFGLRRVGEDDALRAVRAAVAMQESYRALVREQPMLGGAGLRVGVNTGEVVVSGTEDDVVGDPVNVAARLQEQGRDGDVVVGEATRRLVATHVTLAPLGSVMLKGRAEAVAVYRVESLEPPATAAAAPFVGRDDELGRLRAVYDAAIAAPAARLAVLLGSPGLGKSRLIDELGRRLGDGASVLGAHCDAAGSATFAPLVAALRARLGIEDAATTEAQRAAIDAALAADEADRGRVAGGIAALLAGSPAPPEETFYVVRRFLAALARVKPVVLVIDDLHWAEPLLLDLVEHLVQWGSGVPLFVLVGARPELRDVRSSLVVPGGLVSDVVTLGGLDAGAAMRLAANVIGAADLPAAVAAKVLATSEGNPLFVGELVRMLVQEGALTKEGERWVASAGLAAIEMPPTIHALLAARIERLRTEERTVLERASVVGRHFSRGAVAALLGTNGASPNARDASSLDARLDSLRRSELIEPDAGWMLGEPVLRFHHVLIRDAAYRRLLKGTRAELHERLADWIEGQVSDAPEHDETVGWHLEQAHQHLRELGPLDAHATALGERAATRLAAAGRRALARDDVPLAAGLLGRAIDRLDAAAPARPDLALDWCEALLSAGAVGPAAAAIAELDRLAVGSERLRGWHTCFAGQLTVMTVPEELHAAAERVAGAARDLAAQNDAAGEAKAHFVYAQALARLGKVGACEAALDQALAAARRAGDRRRANAVLAGAPLAALWGPSPVTRASGRCLDVVRVLRITQGAPAVEAVALSCQGVLEALRGRTDAARRMLTSSRMMVEELGITQRVYEVDVFIGRLDLLEGNAAAAERRIRPAYDGLRELGLGIDAARAASLLGRALLAQDRAAEAERVSHESEQLAGDDLPAAIAWRGVRAEALAARGEHAGAIALAQAAVEIAAATDALLDHADARVALAAAMQAAGRRSEADAEERRATELWETKGATLLVERAGRAPTAAPAAPPLSSPRADRRVRPNVAAAVAARFEAAVAARDEAALAALFSPELEVVDHQNGVTYGHAGQLDSLRRLFHMQDVTFQVEPLATLGESLLLWRRRIRARGAPGARFDVGDVERNEVVLFEASDDSRIGRIEVFAGNRLNDATTRLYERYAERLPDGPECTRAAAFAATAATVLGWNLGRLPSSESFLVPDAEAADHRRIGLWSARGVDEIERHFRALETVATDVVMSVEVLLAIAPGALLFRRMHSGVDRGGGGRYEREFLFLAVGGADGRLARIEWFDTDQEAEALARFDALTRATEGATPPERPARRRVAPNDFTRLSAECERIVAARDFPALATFFAEDAECVDRPTGTTYGAEGMRTGLLRLMQSPDARWRAVPLASLGRSWGLFRREVSASAAIGTRVDVGPYEIVDLAVYGADPHGRVRYSDVFPIDRLQSAIARLYERYAESLPDGPERARATGIARATANVDGVVRDFDELAKRYTPSFVCVDHRTLGTWSARNREEWLRHARTQNELADGFTLRDDDVLALGLDGSVVRQTYFGTNRASGGAFENLVVMVTIFDAEGLIARSEIFEPEQEAEALACFDALTARAGTTRPLRRRVQPNAATRTCAAIEAAFARRDLAAVEAQLAEGMETIEHPTGTTYGRAGQLESTSRMMRLPDLDFRLEPLASLGESLCLIRRTVIASGTAGGRFDVGEFEIENVIVQTVDDSGRLVTSEVFAADRLGDAIARLYERYAETLPDGASRERAAVTARAVAFILLPGRADLDALYAPSYKDVDHRIVGYGELSLDQTDALMSSLDAVAESHRFRIDDVLALSTSGFVRQTVSSGVWRDGGGSFERTVCTLTVFGDDGRVTGHETFEGDQEAEALARFDALTAGAASAPVRRVRANTATRSLERFVAAVNARDADVVAEILDESLQLVHHQTGATYGRRGMLATWRSIMKAAVSDLRGEILGTLGETLELDRHVTRAEGWSEAHLADTGSMELEEICVIETNDRGGWLRCELFAAEHLHKGVIRLYERYAESLPDGPARARAAAMAGVASSEDLANRVKDVLALGPDAFVLRLTSRDSQPPLLFLAVCGTDGIAVRREFFDVDHEAEALARYDSFVGDVAAPSVVDAFANLATRFNEHFGRAWAARDREALKALHARIGGVEDRRRLMQLEGGVELFGAYLDVPNGRWSVTPIATRGERLALSRVLFEGNVDAEGGDLAIEYLSVDEVDTDGLSVGLVLFDPTDREAAQAELEARWLGDASTARSPASAYQQAFARALGDREWDALAALHAPTLVARDHRLVGWDVLTGPVAYLGALRAMVALAPDAVGRLDHLRIADRGMIAEVVWSGTRDGGAFESPFVWVVELDAEGRGARLEFYDPHHFDAARARFEELR